MPEDNLNDDVETLEEAKFKLEKEKWQAKKLLAIKAFWSIIVLTLIISAAFFFKEDISSFSSISGYLIAVVTGLVSLIGVFMGFSTWFSKSK